MAFLTGERQNTTFVVKTPAGMWEVANTWLNEKVFLIFLRLWQDDTGKAVYTFQEIAEAFGYADRRNVHNYWREFVACGTEFFALLRRKRKVTDRTNKKHFSAGPSGSQPRKTPLGHPSVTRWWPLLARDAGGGPSV
jgi:hypothetical protein